ncbi:hypothetical protein [Streptomyces shenzhenensis]|uniref:hypothetical protein n=1 Tax=Streptomyces shenzhenensis TaxID=943815 RepID=UPI0033F1F50C
MRPRSHFTPRHGWMNDPNGLINHDGRWHLFFQHAPKASTGGTQCRWPERGNLQ